MKVLTRIGMFYGITFVFTILLAIFQQALGFDPGQLSLPQFGPGFAAIVMLISFRSDRVKFTFSFKGIRFMKVLGAIGIPLAVPAMLFLIYSRMISPISIPPIDTISLITLLGGILVGAIGEEAGWRGYAQNLLERRTNGVAAFLIVGVLWGVWHIGNFQHGPLYMLFFVASTIGYSAVIGWLLQGTGANMLLAGLFHFGVNAGFYILQNAMTDIRLVALNGFVWLGAAVIIGIRYRKTSLPAASPPQSELHLPGQPGSGSTLPGA